MRAVFSFFLICCGYFTNAQITITGNVYDCDTSEPIPFITISTLDADEFITQGDIDGNFSFELPTTPATLVLRFVGYQEKTIQIDKAGNYSFCIDEYPMEVWLPEPMILSAPINLFMPVPFMKMTKRQLNRDSDVAITPILNRAPGLYMHSGALNTNRITIRGIGNRSPFSTTKIRAYLDDIPLTTGDGETTIEDIDLSLIDEVNIWKGPTASIFGAGLGGMIHLKTNVLGYSDDSFLSTKTTVGSYGLIRNASMFNLRNDKHKFNLKINYNTTQSDGYRDNNEYDRQGFTVLGKALLNDNNETKLFVNLTNLKAFIPSSLSREDYENEPTKAAFTWGQVKGFEDTQKIFIGLSHRSTFSTIGDFELTNSSTLFARFRDTYESRPFNILDDNSQTMGLRTSFELNPKSQTAIPFPLLSVGLEWFNENYDWQTFETNDGAQGNVISDNKENRTYYNLFAQYYQTLGDDFGLLVGLNANHTDYDYEDLFNVDSFNLSGQYGFDWVISPQIGLNYQFNYSHALFATVSHGFSPPSLSETLTPDGAINTEIQPEKGWNFEIGGRGKIWDKLSYELTIYNMIVRDLLVADRIGPDQFVGINAGKTRHSGVELYANYNLSINNALIQFFTTYTFADYEFVDFKDGDDDYSGNKLTGTAPHHFNIGVESKTAIGFYGNINFQQVAAFPMRDDNSISSDPYQVMNLKLGFKKRIWRKLQFDLYVGIQNLLDEQYASMILINAGSFGGNAPRYFYPGLPRNYYGGLNLKYDL